MRKEQRDIPIGIAAACQLRGENSASWQPSELVFVSLPRSSSKLLCRPRDFVFAGWHAALSAFCF